MNQLSAITAKLDTIFSQIVRARDIVCQFPGCGKRATQNAHCFGRASRTVRWDLDDCLGMCDEHHRLIDTSPFAHFKEVLWKNKLGAEAYDALNFRARQSIKLYQSDLEDLYQKFKKIKNES